MNYLNDPDDRRDYIARLGDAIALISQAIDRLPEKQAEEIVKLHQVKAKLKADLQEVMQ